VSRLASCVVASVLLVGCGDDGGGGGDPPDAERADDAAPPIDAEPIDAMVCETAGYPQRAEVVTIEQEAPHQLTLDGEGTRCEQLVRALTGAAGRPPELDGLDPGGAEATCEYDDVLDRDIVRIFFRQYAGVPIFGPVQDVLAHVDQSNLVVYLAGNYVEAGQVLPAACLDDAQIAAGVPGEALAYTRFAACSPQGDGEYTVVADDEIEVGALGVYVDGEGDLRRVWAVDVYLLEDHVTDETTNSDLFCCFADLDHCVGKRLFIDALTVEVVGDEPHCHTC
jgi:hypothetical protein